MRDPDICNFSTEVRGHHAPGAASVVSGHLVTDVSLVSGQRLQQMSRADNPICVSRLIMTLCHVITLHFMNNLCRHHGSRLSPSVGFISHSNIFIITQYEGQIMNLFLIIEVHREMCHSTKQNQAKFISALNKRFLFKVTTQIWETLMST